MKNIIKYAGGLLGVVGVLSLQSCDKNLESINTNPEATAKVYPQYVFTKAQYDGTANMLKFLLGTMQYTTSYNDVAGFGSKYNAAQISQTYQAFNDGYPKEINELSIVIKSVKNESPLINLYAAARIWRVYCFSRLTDLYGDLPYFKAGLGYDSLLFKPAYDPQSAIYADMLSELEAAAKSFDPTNKVTFGASDLIYGGNIDRWKKFAYSLMLRLGMRMTKVDANAAKTWVTKAIAGGVITNDVDIAKMSYLASGQDINKNPLAFNLWNSDYIAQDGNKNTEGGKYQDVFISHLKNTNDPRLPMMAVVWNAGKADTSVALAKGMPATLANAKPANFVTYSEPNPNTILLMNSPSLVFTAAESYFLLTEAALRGWYTGATASNLYESGIRAAMRQWGIISPAGAIDPAAVNNYVTANPLNTGGSFDDQMKQIYTQFWVSIFPDAQEVFASFRRTGYPALVPNNYAGNATGGKFFRRMLYPTTEQTLNADSYADAIARQGANDLLTRIWWDKQ